MGVGRTVRAVVITAAMVLIVAACGEGAQESEAGGAGGGTEAIAPVGTEVAGELTVWTWEGAPGAEAMDALATAFEEETGVAVDSAVKERDDYTAQVQLALNSGEPIDVLGVQPSAVAAEMQPQLMPVSSYADRLQDGLEGYEPLTLEQTDKLYEGDEIYSVPVGSTGSAVCFYNADLLEEVGAEVPQTWEDVQALTEALEASGSDALTLVKPSGADTWFEDEFVLTMVGQIEPGFYNSVRYDDEPWNQDSYVQGLSRYGELYESGTLQRSSLDLAYADAMNAFNTGRAAIACNGTWEAGLLKQEFREANEIDISSVGVMPVPADDPSTRSLRSFLDITWGIPTTAQNPSAAAAFIDFATQGEGVDLWAEGLGFVPADADWELNDDVLTDELAVQGYETIQELIQNPSSDRNNLSSFSAQVGTYVLEVAQGRMTAEDAADQGQQDFESGLYEG